MRLVFASNNAHKLEEVRQIMPSDIDVVSLNEAGFSDEIEETGTTLAENSRIKAETIWTWLQANAQTKELVDGVFADDTGLEIDALNGQPGVYTARWYLLDAEGREGEHQENGQKVFAANRAKALRLLKGETNRGAQFKTVITLIRVEHGAAGQQNTMIQVEGVVRGQIATEERGEKGFGYDPVFIPDGYDRTFAELPAEIKNTISHRARALEELVKLLK